MPDMLSDAGQARADGRTTVLLTGFGPFPSVTSNATMMLVPRLAAATRLIFPSTRIVAAILPTEWHAAPARVERLIAQHRPDLMIHFGVSHRARGFEIEARGRNACVLASDASGRYPDDAFLHDSGQELLPSRLPVAEIVRRLRARGWPAYRSWDAGTYLCNATLYHALHTTGERVAQVGFVHVPSQLAPSGRALGAALRTSPGCPLTWPQALSGGIEIVAACLGKPSPSRALVARVSATPSTLAAALR